MRKQFLAGCVLSVFVLANASQNVLAATYNVINNSSDVGTLGSLPWCVNAANNVTPGQPDIINFVTSNSITVHSVLFVTDQVDIRGNSNSVGAHDGTGAGILDCFGFSAGSDGSTLTGLAIIDSNQAVIFQSNAHRIYNCRVGLDWTGNARGNGIGVLDLGRYNYIGGTTAAERNYISDNSIGGIYLSDSSCCVIQGNYLGTDLAGNAALGTQFAGVYLNNAAFAYIGGDRTNNEGNVISGNQNGVLFWHGNLGGNSLCGNTIGLNAAENSAVPNTDIGVAVFSTVGNFIGMPLANHENVIAGNVNYNIAIRQQGSPMRPRENVIRNNYIGINQSGAVFSNGLGIELREADGNLIGGRLQDAYYERNFIGWHSGLAGIRIWNTSTGNTISGNYIGTTPEGSTPRQNTTGILLESDNNLIGGLNIIEGDGLGNLISGNTNHGIQVWDASHNTISGNFIGLTRTLDASLPNGQHGIYIGGTSSNNLIGGWNALPNSVNANIVSGNMQDGIRVANGTANMIMGNLIGLGGDLVSPISNQNGIYIEAPASNTRIGDLDTAYHNVVAGNYQGGIRLVSGTTGNQVIGNLVGISDTGVQSVNGSGVSIYLSGSPQNLIAANRTARTIQLIGDAAWGNSVVANIVGVLPDGSPVSGLGDGVLINVSSHGNFIGLPASGQGNLISNTTTYGVHLVGAAAMNNGLYANTITAFGTAGIYLESGANGNKSAPAITSANSLTTIEGMSDIDDYIEVFVAEGAAGNGGSVRFVGYTTADGGGNWSVLAGGLLVSGDYVCATARDSGNNTSGFSTNVLVVGPTVTPTVTVTLTLTPSPVLTSTPTFTPTLTVTLTPIATATFTVTPTQTITSTSALSSVDLGGKQVLPYPNPAQDQVFFVFHLDQAAEVKIMIYNMTGERVAELSGDFMAGRGQILIWDCRDAAPGVYLARFALGGKVKETVKIAVVQ